MPDINSSIRIQQELRKNNPFMSSASAMPWDNNTPDLEQLNRPVSEEIEQLILYKRRNPSVPVAGLILGEPGSGKTHMLTRILRKLRKHDKYSIFVTVKTFVNSETVTYNLLSEIFLSLRQHHSSETKSQFDMLVNEIFETYKERMENEGFSSASITSSDAKKYLAQAMPGIDKNVLKCLMLYRSTSDKDIKWQILEWLSSGLDDEDSHDLGLPFRDVDSMTDAKREEEASKILFSLGLLLAYAHVPMIICFDQLDGMKDKELISAWGNMISMLMNDLSGVLPLCFVKFATWSSVITPALDPSVIQRLNLHTMRMKECSLAQEKLLIHERVAEAFKGSNSEEKYYWLITRLEKILKPGFSPRMVIELANKEIFKDDDILPDPDVDKDKSEIFKTIQNVYKEECSKIKSQPLSWPPNVNQLAIALEVWLSSHEGFEVTRYTDKRLLKIRAKYKAKEFAFYIVISKIAYLPIGALKQGKKLLEDSPDIQCFYISEREIKPKAPKSYACMMEFKNSGGHVILDEDTRSEWYGLFLLVSRIDNGDVDLLLDSGNRTATRDDIKEFVKTLTLINIDIEPAKKKSSKPVVLPVKPDVLGRALLDILNDSPMQIMAVVKVIEFLSDKKGIKISEVELEAFVKANPNVFKLFTSQNDELLIGLVNK